MSLVELALKKMQSARPDSRKAGVATDRGQAAEGKQVVGEVVHRTSHRPITEAENVPSGGKLIRIDRNALRAAGLAPSEHQQRELSDQYRQIKRPLVRAALSRDALRPERGQLIMMASAMPKEGKTFTSINLALSLSLEKDVSVLLVDADVSKPHISRTFGLEREAGLLDVLHDAQANVESLILPTDVPNLSILPAGTRSDTAAEMLASQRMEETMNYLAQSNLNRIVLIDSSPVLLTPESRALAHWVGQIVLVVRADMTPHRAVLDAIEHLGGAGKSINLVLNQSRFSSPGYYYGYGDSSAANTADG